MKNATKPSRKYVTAINYWYKSKSGSERIGLVLVAGKIQGMGGERYFERVKAAIFADQTKMNLNPEEVDEFIDLNVISRLI